MKRFNMWITTYTNTAEQSYKSISYSNNKDAVELFDILYDSLMDSGYYCMSISGEVHNPVVLIYYKKTVVGTLSVTKLS